MKGILRIGYFRLNSELAYRQRVHGSCNGPATACTDTPLTRRTRPWSCGSDVSEATENWNVPAAAAKFEEAYDANERAVRDLPWSKIADLEAKHEYGKAIDVTKQTLRYFPRNHRNHRLQGELKALKQRAKEQKRQHRGEASQRKTESHRDSETAGTAGRAASKGLRTIWRR